MVINMRIYILSPVRNVSQEQQDIIDNHVKTLELDGHEVYLPIRDTNQLDPTGMDICLSYLLAMLEADRIDIFWDITSSGSHFDLGMAFASGKRLKLIYTFTPDSEGKSYLKVIKELIEFQAKTKNHFCNRNFNYN